MNPDAPNPLADLRDIHLADPVSAWPPALGWWLLAAIVLVSMTIWGYRRISQHRARAFWRSALNQLHELQNEPHITGQAALFAYNALLKRAAIKGYPADNVAALNGQRWLDWLAQHGFDNNASEQLLAQWYRPTIEQSLVNDFQARAERWLHQQSREWRRV